MTSEARKITATYLDKLKIKNPLIFVGLAFTANIFIWMVNHPESYQYYTGYEVTALTEYLRDGFIAATTFAGYSTFKDLPENHPKKVAAKGEVIGQQEKF
jgi:hypothetical protein